jgi:hypothetical protein
MMKDDLRDDIKEIEKQIRGYLEELRRSARGPGSETTPRLQQKIMEASARKQILWKQLWQLRRSSD